MGVVSPFSKWRAWPVLIDEDSRERAVYDSHVEGVVAGLCGGD